MDWPANAGGFVCQCLTKTAPFVGDHEIAFFICSNTKIKVCIFSTASLIGLSGYCALAFLNALEHKRSSFVRVLRICSATYENRIALAFRTLRCVRRPYLFRFDNK